MFINTDLIGCPVFNLTMTLTNDLEVKFLGVSFLRGELNKITLNSSKRITNNKYGFERVYLPSNQRPGNDFEVEGGGGIRLPGSKGTPTQN